MSEEKKRQEDEMNTVISSQGVMAACKKAGIGPDDLFRAMSGNKVSAFTHGKIKTCVSSWIVFFKKNGKCYYANVGDSPDAEANTVTTEMVINPGTSKLWTDASQIDCSSMSDIWRNGPLGAIKYDFYDVVSYVEEQGYQLMQNWYSGSATYLLRKILVENDLKVVWQLPLSKNDTVEGLSFVDAHTGGIYVLYFDESKQHLRIDSEP